MKVLLHYEDNPDTELWKSLKITLPKSWKNGPTSKLLAQFIESYNANASLGESNPLTESSMHLTIRKKQTDGTTKLESLASDDITLECIPDRADVYICHGPSTTRSERAAAAKAAATTDTVKTVQCTRFGCQKRFPPGEPPDSSICQHHTGPPVFHETAKFWSCCPHKKAYDWDDFQAIPGCSTSEKCTEVKEDAKRQFLGGTDLREEATKAVALKSIDDFNKEQGGVGTSNTLERLQVVLEELDIDKELFDQVVEGIRQDLGAASLSAEEITEAVKKEMSKILKSALKGVAAERLRIK